MCRGCGKTFPDRTGTVLSSSKLRQSQIRTLLSMPSDGTTLRQAAQKAHVSLLTALLWKREIQRIPENAGNKVLSGDVWVDHTYVNVPMSERRGRKKRGLSRRLLQVAVGIDSYGRVLIRLGTRGAAGTGDSRVPSLAMWHRALPSTTTGGTSDGASPDAGRWPSSRRMGRPMGC